MHCTLPTIGLEINSELTVKLMTSHWELREDKKETFGEASSTSFRWAPDRNDSKQLLLSVQVN